MAQEADDRWYFSKDYLLNETPSRKHGYDADKELSCRQQAANFIQDIGQKLQVSQLCINTAIVYMHRFYVFHSLVKFHRNAIATAALFLAAKVEEQPRKVEHVLKVAHICLHRDGSSTLDTKSDAYAEQSSELVLNESLLLQTLGFDVAIDHPHTHVVRCCQLVKASKDLAQTSYFMASNSLHLTTMCLQYRPTVVACVCIHLACKWSNWEIPRSSEGKDWFWYVNQSVTLDLLEQLTSEFLSIFDKCPTKLKRKMMSMNQSNAPNFGPSTSQDSYHFEEPRKILGPDGRAIEGISITHKFLGEKSSSSSSSQHSSSSSQHSSSSSQHSSSSSQHVSSQHPRHIDYKEYKEKKERERLERELREKQRAEVHGQQQQPQPQHISSKPVPPGQKPPEKPLPLQQKQLAMMHKIYPPSHHRPHQPGQQPPVKDPNNPAMRPHSKDLKRKYEEIDLTSEAHKKFTRREGDRTQMKKPGFPPEQTAHINPAPAKDPTSGIREIITQVAAPHRGKVNYPPNYPFAVATDKYGRPQPVPPTAIAREKTDDKEKILDPEITEIYNKSLPEKYPPKPQKPREPNFSRVKADASLMKQKTADLYKKAPEKLPTLWEKAHRSDDRSLPQLIDTIPDLHQVRTHMEEPKSVLTDDHLSGFQPVPLMQPPAYESEKPFTGLVEETKINKHSSIFSPDINESYGQTHKDSGDYFMQKITKKPSTSLFSPPAFSGAPPQRTNSSSSERELIITPHIPPPEKEMRSAMDELLPLIDETRMDPPFDIRMELTKEPPPIPIKLPVPSQVVPETALIDPLQTSHYAIPDMKPRPSYPTTSTVNLLGMEKMVDTSISPEKKPLKPYEIAIAKPVEKPKEDKEPRDDVHRKSEKKKKESHKERHKEKKKSDSKKEKKKHKEKDRDREQKKSPLMTDSQLKITIPKDKIGLPGPSTSDSSLKIKIAKDRLKPTLEKPTNEGGLKIKISKDVINSYKDEKGTGKKKEIASHHKSAKSVEKNWSAF